MAQQSARAPMTVRTLSANRWPHEEEHPIPERILRQREARSRIAAQVDGSTRLIPYGTAKDDPLGRDGFGWTISPQTLLPVRVKAPKGEA